jgi:prepilin-type processing-associated H-X9-DG protein
MSYRRSIFALFAIAVIASGCGSRERQFEVEAQVSMRIVWALELYQTCPNDKKRMPPATSFSSITDRKVSYFLNLGATIDRPDAVLAGDRNVATNGVGLPGGIAQIQDVQTVNWTKAFHEGNGNVALADGSARQLTSKQFQDFLKTTMIVTNALVIP